MTYLNGILSGAFIDALGWTLVHSIWQGALLASLVVVIMILLRKGAARTRYLVYFSSLLLMLGLSVLTFINVYEPAGASEVLLTEQQISNTADMLPMQEQQVADEETQFEQAKQAFAAYFERNFPLFVSLWLLGICFFLLKFLGGYAYSQRLRHYRTLEVTEFWKRKLIILGNKIGMQKSIRLAESALIKVPMVIGFFKPVILLPLGMLASLPPQQVEAILTHELAHIYRKDYLFNLIQSIIDILFFYHPAIWWISKNIRVEREHICDDLVIMHSQDSLAYARALASVQEMKSNYPVPAPALARNKYELLNRIQRMMNKPRIIPSFAEGFMSALIILAGIIGMSATAAISFGSEELPSFGIESQPTNTFVKSEPIQVVPIESNGIAIGTPVLAPDTITDQERDSIMKIVEYEMQKAMQELEVALEAREAAMEKYHEAMELQGQAHQKMMQEFQEQFDDTDVHFHTYSSPSRVKNYRKYDRKFRDPHVKHGYFFSDEHAEVIEELHEELLELEELAEIKELQEIDEWIEFEELEELEDVHEMLEHWDFEMPEMPSFDDQYNYQYHYTYPDNVWSHYSDKTKNVILKELRRDRLIGMGGDQVIELDSKGLYINGEKQSKEIYKKYKRLYESLEDTEITAEHSYKLIL